MVERRVFTIVDVLWNSCKPVQVQVGKLCCSRFNHRESPVKAVYGWFNPIKDGESHCNHVVAAVKLVQDCLSVGNVHYKEFDHRGDLVKAVKGIFNLRKD